MVIKKPSQSHVIAHFGFGFAYGKLGQEYWDIHCRYQHVAIATKKCVLHRQFGWSELDGRVGEGCKPICISSDRELWIYGEEEWVNWHSVPLNLSPWDSNPIPLTRAPQEGQGPSMSYSHLCHGLLWRKSGISWVAKLRVWEKMPSFQRNLAGCLEMPTMSMMSCATPDIPKLPHNNSWHISRCSAFSLPWTGATLDMGLLVLWTNGVYGHYDGITQISFPSHSPNPLYMRCVECSAKPGFVKAS